LKHQYESHEDDKLVEYGLEDESVITDEQILRLLKEEPGASVILEMVRPLWNCRRYMNIKVMGRSRNKCFYFNGETWKAIDTRILADQIIKRMGSHIDERKRENRDIGRACIYLPFSRDNYNKYINILDTDNGKKSIRPGKTARLKDMQDGIIKYLANMDLKLSEVL
jgi:hypothetical protein